MAAQDVTPLFKTALSSAQSLLPPSRTKSPHRSKSPHPRSDKGKSRETQEEFLKEAYRIHTHLDSLSTLLQNIRKAYLSTSTGPIRRAQRAATNGVASSDIQSLDEWKDSKHLSDRERDEIDLRGKVILRRCRERVMLLEDQEKLRQKQVAAPTISTLYSFLPSLAPVEDTSTTAESLITAHRSSVLWTLNQLMAKIGGTMGDMQEERHKRREERSRTLGSQAAREATKFDRDPGAIQNLFGLSKPSPTKEPPKGIIPENEPSIDDQLSPEQVQQFALENNALVEHMESQLTSVLAAEKSLLEISALQTELVRHLAQQTEMTEQLYDQAVGSVGDMDKATEQLKKARQRGKEGRLFLLIFLLGASFALLFLDWYA